MSVRPATRSGDSKAHLLADHEHWALCGRPAGPGGTWQMLEAAPPAKERCRDCVTAGEHLPRARPAVPIHPWNPRL